MYIYINAVNEYTQYILYLFLSILIVIWKHCAKQCMSWYKLHCEIGKKYNHKIVWAESKDTCMRNTAIRALCSVRIINGQMHVCLTVRFNDAFVANHDTINMGQVRHDNTFLSVKNCFY